MGMGEDVEAVLLTGLFGAGKTSVAVEIADALEKRGIPYAVIDLDWLSWGWPGSDEEGAEHRMMLANLEPVVRNYLEAGVRFLVLARAINSSWELQTLRAALPMPLRVVGLTAPWPDIERRLRADITSGRQDDLREAAARAASSDGTDLADLVIVNDRPIRTVAKETLDRLGWLANG
jgi:hypothetical protein